MLQRQSWSRHKHNPTLLDKAQTIHTLQQQEEEEEEGGVKYTGMVNM
jgi:hypothetical protein